MNSISELPNFLVLQRTAKALAILDAILSPEWEYRYFSFNSRWDDGIEMASARTGQGDECYLLFTSKGVGGKVYCRGNTIADWADKLATIPDELIQFKTEPAFSLSQTTFYFWNCNSEWKINPEYQGPSLIDFYVYGPQYYRDWAGKYYEKTISINDIEAIFAHHALSVTLASSINADVDFDALIDDLTEINYPWNP